MPVLRINPGAVSRSSLVRLDTVPGLNEAQRMNLFERIVSWKRDGVKSETIKQAFDLLRAPGGGGGAGAAQHEALLRHFDMLQSALRPERMDKCLLTTQLDVGGQTWSYRMHVDDEMLLGVTGVPIGTGHLLKAFEDHAVLADLGQYLQKNFRADFPDQREVLRERFAAIDAGHADLAGAAVTHAGLEKFRLLGASLLQLGVSVSDCFPGVDVSSDARAVQLSLGNHVLGVYPIANRQVLTDTLTTMVQVCRDAIDQMLQMRGPRQAATGGPEEAEINELTSIARGGLASVLSHLKADEHARVGLGFADVAAVDDFFQHLKENVLAPMRIGHTDLAQVWQLGATAYGSLEPAAARAGANGAASASMAANLPAELERQETHMLASYKA